MLKSFIALVEGGGVMEYLSLARKRKKKTTHKKNVGVINYNNEARPHRALRSNIQTATQGLKTADVGVKDGSQGGITA